MFFLYWDRSALYVSLQRQGHTLEVELQEEIDKNSSHQHIKIPMSQVNSNHKKNRNLNVNIRIKERALFSLVNKPRS